MSRRRPRSAAIFDLDRTLLTGASGPTYSAALKRKGVVPDTPNPIEPLMFRVFDVIGETWPSMQFTKAAGRLVRGWNAADVVAAGEEASTELVERVAPFARSLIEEHRSNGVALVMATTTPHDLAAPLAERLGFDHLIATRHVRRDGVYTGQFDGPFIWGKSKAEAVRRWSEGERIDLSTSWAYSDSYYDLPLLGSVGNPTAVNPDPRLLAMAILRRWPVTWLDVPPGVPKLVGLEPQRIAMFLARGELFPYVRFRTYHVSRLPTEGPAIIVGNHRSYFDPLAIGYLLAKRGRPVRFLGKKEVFDAPVVGEVATAMGGIRVDRGTGSDAPLRAAEEALRAGEMVAMMPQGTIPRGRAFFDPVLRGRWGAARLAAATGAPVIPIGLWGTEHVWPRSSRVPFVHNVLRPPTVTMRVGTPVKLRLDDVEADTHAIMDAISALLPPEARRSHEPTEDELRRSLPPGAGLADSDHEAARRPGSD